MSTIICQGFLLRKPMTRKKPDFKIMDVVHFSKWGLTQIKPYKSMVGIVLDVQGDFLKVSRQNVRTVRWWFWEYWEHYE